MTGQVNIANLRRWLRKRANNEAGYTLSSQAAKDAFEDTLKYLDKASKRNTAVKAVERGERARQRYGR